MRGFFSFWGEALKRALSAGWGVLGVMSIVIPAAIACALHLAPSLSHIPWIRWVSEYQAELQVGIALVALVAYLAYAPYRLCKERDTLIKSLKSRLDAYEAIPVTAVAKYVSKDSWIKILVINRGHQEQRILGVHLSISASFAEIVDDGLLLKSLSRIESFPHIMAPHSSFELEIAYTVENLLGFGAQSFCAVVSFEDGRELRGDIVDISRIQQQDFSSFGLEESISRFKRIRHFVEDYKIRALGRNENDLDLALMVQAGVLELHSKEELETACDILFTEHVPHALRLVDFDGVNILDFFWEMAQGKTDISGSNGRLELLYWRRDRLTSPSQVPETALPLLEPSSPACPETDTHCSD